VGKDFKVRVVQLRQQGWAWLGQIIGRVGSERDFPSTASTGKEDSMSLFKT